MLVFVTGSTGFIGSRVVEDLRSRGHDVLGLTRTEEGVRQLERLGAKPVLGDLSDLHLLRSTAASADAAVHLAFGHDFTKYPANCAHDRQVVEAIGTALAPSGGKLVVTSVATLGLDQDHPVAIERITHEESSPNLRVATELGCRTVRDAGADVRIVRLPQVHDETRWGLITFYVELARRTGSVAYAGEGDNRWAAVHVNDAARLYGLALDEGEPGARYNAVAEEGVAMRAIAEVVGARLDLPVVSVSKQEAEERLGWFSRFADSNHAASGAWTQKELEWGPAGPTLLADLERL